MTITRAMVERELRELPRKKSNVRTVHGCVYTDDHGEHCIAGQVLTNLGVKVPGHHEHGNGGLSVTQLVNERHIAVADDAVRLLQAAQGIADGTHNNGKPVAWGKVVDEILAPKAKAAPWYTNPTFVNPPAAPPKSFAFHHDLQHAHPSIISGPIFAFDNFIPSVPKPAEPHTLSTKAVEEYAGVPEPTLRRWRDQGIIDHIHYPTTTQWAPETARIARVLARLPKLSPEVYRQVAEKLRDCSSNWRYTFLVIGGDSALATVKVLVGWKLEQELALHNGHTTVLSLDKL